MLALAARGRGHVERAVLLLEECLAVARTGPNPANVAMFLTNLGVLALDTGRYARAADLYVEALAINRSLQDSWGVATCLTNLGEVRHLQGLQAETVTLFREGLALHQRLGHAQGLTESLEGLARVAVTLARLETAARLFGAAGTMRRTLGFAPHEGEEARRRRAIEDLRAAMGEAGDGGRGTAATPFDTSWAAGTLLAADEAIAEAMTVGDERD